MKRVVIPVALIVFSLCLRAQVAQKPQHVAFTPITAEELIASCKDVDADANSKFAEVCLTYIAGFTDGYNIAMARFNKEKQSAFAHRKK
jgi:hypothetical protein